MRSAQVIQAVIAFLFVTAFANSQTRDIRVIRVDPTLQKNFQKSVKVALVVGINAYSDGSGLSPL